MKFLITAFLSIVLLSAHGQADSILRDFSNRPDHILVAAHRAPHADYPENSLAAIREAIRLGVDIVELDIRQTKDGILVLMHDKTITRTTGKPGGTGDYTYAELQQFPLLHNGQPTQERIPTFEEALKLTKDRILVDIDFKEGTPEAARKTVELVKASGTTSQVLFFLYDYKEIPQLRNWNPKIPIMPRAYNTGDIAGIGQMGTFPAIHIDDSYYSDSLANALRAGGTRVWLNALGKYDKAEKASPGTGFSELLKKHPRVNIIQTDLPAELLAYLRSKGFHR
ncbi:glycerophosphodiester phosphodiesterase [Chitinophaga lutea]|uniref:Glycerophosphodiester phosphodiesterase n=1 Tax=Chitinophaga lutea TaxID=2488634 RepID=A0A3N4Q4U0_9BACT|nr:glycerophosphodiester phosphodiesterase family protein [Chitinophaga lutea]RPE14249.1 glycerophosphodiester phosphodiesterase [Chitinophaga lutea]